MWPVKPKPKLEAWRVAVAAAAVYVAVSALTFAFRNPCFTQTELLLNLGQALVWSHHDFCRDRKLYYPPWAR